MVGRPNSFRENFTETRLLHDPAAVRAEARQRPLYLGSQPTKRLQKFGVGVPMLWPTVPVRNLRFAPLGMQAWHGLTAPPMAVLWAAANTADRIVASVHVEFVGDVARVCEAVDIQANGVGSSYLLSAEPVDQVIARCVDTLGFSATPVDGVVTTRFRASFPFRWDAGGPSVVPEAQMRNLLVRFAVAPGTTPTITEQVRSACDDVRLLADAPTRPDVDAALHDFVRPGLVG